MSAKTATKRKPAQLVEPAPAPLLGPETRAQWSKRIVDAMFKPDPPLEVREQFRALLKDDPEFALAFGTLPGMVRKQALDRFKNLPAMEESIRFQLDQLRADLAGPAPSPLEQLLVEAVILCYQDYFLFALSYSLNTKGEIALSALEKWERILSSKEARYLRAIAELGRVRRLLNLPAPQINVNLPGGQQVNVAGDVQV